MLNTAPLFLKRDTIHRRGLAAAEKLPFPVRSVEIATNLPVRQPQALALRSHRNLSPDQAGSLDVPVRHIQKSSGSAAKIRAIHRGNGVRNSGIPVNVCDVNVVYDVNIPIYERPVSKSRIITAPIPRIIRLIRRERHPADIPEA
jgi:hypothetical protein